MIFREDFFISYRSAIHHFHQQLKIHLNLDIFSFFCIVIVGGVAFACLTLSTSKLQARHNTAAVAAAAFFLSLTMFALPCIVCTVYSWI